MITIKTGVDLEQTKRFTRFKPTSSFIKMIFTQSEIDYCFRYKDFWTHLAGRFTAKEAVIKAAVSLTEVGLSLKDIEITVSKDGIPGVKINKPILKDTSISLSISHTNNLAISFVIIYKQNL